jgi:Carboxypeptidase regulatory-like domain
MISRIADARAVVVALCALGALVTPTAAAAAQQGTIRGRVVDRSSNAGLADVELVFLGDNRSVHTDSVGRYRFAALPAGTVQLLVRAASFPATQIIVALSPGQDVERTIVLDSTARSADGQPLPAVVVTESEIDRRLVDFHRRRRLGRGHYLTRIEIERSGANSLTDAVRSLRGVTTECGGGGGCFVRMVRAPMQCRPDYVVDRRVDNNFGPTTPIRDIEALEVYTGPSDVPGEFAGQSAGCGVIVIWTRAGPPRRE